VPLVTDTEIPSGNAPVAQLPTPSQDMTPNSSGWATFSAAERQTNVASMLYDRLIQNPRPDVPAVPGFDPIASIPKGYEAYADRFLDAQSPQEVGWIQSRIRAELADRQTIARAGGWGVAASIAAGMTDPLTIASMAVPVAGETRLIQAGRLAVVAAGTTAAQEGVALGTSETHTPEEALTNVASSAILGGILGAVIRPHVPQAEFDQLTAQMDARANANVNPGGPSTVGAAAAAATPSLEQNTIAGAGDLLARSPLGLGAPGLRLLTSPSSEVRQLVQELAETPEMLVKNQAGVATPTAIESILRGYQGDWYEAWKARADAFRDYRERIAGEATDATSDAQPLSRSDFNQEVAYALRRGDQSAIPEAAQAAQDTRRIVFDPLKERAQALGLLPEDLQVEGADSYLMRQYDTRAIRANLGTWIDTLTEGFKEQGLDTAEARDVAYKATRNITGSERGTMDFHVMDDIVPQSGRLKERTLTLPDHLLEPWLNNDVDHLTHSYLRSLAPEVEMTERFGSRDLRDQLGNIKDDYSRLITRATDDGTKDSLYKRMEADMRDVQAVRDRLYGNFGQPKDPGSWFVRAGRLLRSDNALRLLGGATVSHFPDIANVIAKYGLPNTMRALGKLGTSLEAIKLTRDEARRMGIGLDMVMNTTASLLGDYGSHSQFLEQRIANRVTRFFTIATGETPLITTIQSLASAMGSHELLERAIAHANGNVLDKATMAHLASDGIDADMLQRIGEQALQYSKEVNGLKFGMSAKWVDQDASRAFEATVAKQAHSMTLSPGAGDTPLLMSSELGKTLLQFKSFAFAAARHVLMPIAQGVGSGDVRAMQGLFALVAAGYMSYITKQWLANQPIETNPKRVAGEVLDKSNLMAWLGEAIYPALWQAGFKDFSRWSDRDAVETMLGPTAGTLASVYERRFPAKLRGTAIDDPSVGTFSRNDLHFIRRLAPGQNLWYARRAVNGLEDSIGDLFNLPGESNATRQARIASQ
jgi:hypothetical protein